MKHGNESILRRKFIVAEETFLILFPPREQQHISRYITLPLVVRYTVFFFFSTIFDLHFRDSKRASLPRETRDLITPVPCD